MSYQTFHPLSDGLTAHTGRLKNSGQQQMPPKCAVSVFRRP
ncbi:hypothetical protein [Neisseria sp. CCUG12390]